MRHSLLVLSCVLVLAWTVAASGSNKPLWQLTATEAVSLLCARNITAEQLVKSLLQRMDTYRCINAVSELRPAKVLAEAKAIDKKAKRGGNTRPLCGLPIAVKDNIDVLGYKTVAGTPSLEDFLPDASSPLIDRIYRANGIVLAKLRMHELAFAYSSINPRYGPVLNPLDNIMVPGGSSGGSGALVGALGTPVALCTDTGGSCRVPSFVNGAIGWRPSTDCWDASGGLVPLSSTRDTVGVITRSVADVVMINKIMDSCNISYPPPPSVQRLRMGMPTDWWTGFDPQTEAHLNQVLAVLEAAGVEIVPFSFAEMTQFYLDGAFSFGVLNYEFHRETSRYIYNHKYDLSYADFLSKIATPEARDYMQLISFSPLNTFPTPAEYRRMIAQLPELAAKWKAPFDAGNFDIILLPGSYDVAHPINAAEPAHEINGKWGYWRWITSSSGAFLYDPDPHIHVPSLCLPAGVPTGKTTPAGLCLYGSGPETDGTVLAAAAAIENLLPRSPSPPSVPACKGCTPKVKVVKVEVPAGVTVAPNAGPIKGYGYDFSLTGSCKLRKMYEFPLKAPFRVK